MKLPLWQWLLGFVGLSILIFWAFNEMGKKAQKNYVNNQIKRIKEQLNNRLNNPSSRISTDEIIASSKQLKTLRQYQNSI